MTKNSCPILIYFGSQKGPVQTNEKLKELKWILQHYLIYWLFLWTAESTAIHLEYLILIWFVLGSYRCQNKFVIAINIASIMWVRKRSYISRSFMFNAAYKYSNFGREQAIHKKDLMHSFLNQPFRSEHHLAVWIYMMWRYTGL